MVEECMHMVQTLTASYVTKLKHLNKGFLAENLAQNDYKCNKIKPNFMMQEFDQ